MSFYECDSKIAYNAGRQSALLEDIALSLKILSGRETLKELRLEQKLNVLNDRLSACCNNHPGDLEAQQKIFKEIDEIEEELRKERSRE